MSVLFCQVVMYVCISWVSVVKAVLTCMLVYISGFSLGFNLVVFVQPYMDDFKQLPDRRASVFNFAKPVLLHHKTLWLLVHVLTCLIPQCNTFLTAVRYIELHQVCSSLLTVSTAGWFWSVTSFLTDFWPRYSCNGALYSCMASIFCVIIVPKSVSSHKDVFFKDVFIIIIIIIIGMIIISIQPV